MIEWQKFRKMTPKQYEQVIAALGMSQVEAGRFLGHTGRTSRRYVKGSSPVPTADALLLSSLMAHNEKPLVPPGKPGDY